MKKLVDEIDATPSKRIYSSIIADYDLNRSLCELIDNALDCRIRNHNKSQLTVSIQIDTRQQSITVTDNAGGVQRTEFQMLVAPGHTNNSPTDETIGFFGVGSKRAVVAIAQAIRITSRHESGPTYSIELDEPWLKGEQWRMSLYQVDQIAPGTTIIQLDKLRLQLTEESIDLLVEHLRACYALLIKNGDLGLSVGKDTLKELTFENWAFPPQFGPRRYVSTLRTAEGSVVRLSAIAGLTQESSPAEGEYGVYFYCNGRLIARALKSYEVGFTKGVAGLPHPDVSLVRVIVTLSGEAQLMPWNSSKSGINWNHHVFVALRTWLVQVVKDFASLSRRLAGDWPEKVFKYKTGSIEQIDIADLPEVSKSYLPPLPQSRPRYPDVLKKSNDRIAKNKPWVRGLYEGIAAVDVISNQKLEQKNRICLILLDSTLEIGFKEYLVNESGTYYADSQLLTMFKQRHLVDTEVKKYVKLPPDTWKLIAYYHQLRSKLVHERSSAQITDDQLGEFRLVVERVLRKLFRLKFK